MELIPQGQVRKWLILQLNENKEQNVITNYRTNSKLHLESKECLKNKHQGQCYKTFYRCNLLPFLGNTIILRYKAILPW
jgi:hypothetical protein